MAGSLLQLYKTGSYRVGQVGSVCLLKNVHAVLKEQVLKLMSFMDIHLMNDQIICFKDSTVV